MRIESMEEFGVAAKEYVALLNAIRRTAAVLARVREELRRTALAVRGRMERENRTEMLCADMTTLRVGVTRRREGIKRHHVVAEIVDHIPPQLAGKFWEDVLAKRQVVEREVLGFRADPACAKRN